MEINKNIDLNEQINKLKNEIKEKDIRYENLLKINEQLKNELDIEKNKFKDFQEKIKKDNLKLENELNKRIDKLKEKLSRYPFELSKGEKLISVIFNSMD